ncbi:F-box protein At1g70590 [Herrania umbratica]|uniref:F-box protein At1g70590 n=1 Tax=Herrania umbratica TaxID=108875 RepID=A0A6J1B2M0_9ROSI|nr:F-box protein At1g70590 [Herrania umbratica]XP_021293536.1 F-box protein At1g70590 [Herrania umbratica]XP_021293537.1 F-box protein At1g70590 [Herrania umbratica]XP_021293538.1 F-box protein At1g70590 [Herrania umbratica]
MEQKTWPDRSDGSRFTAFPLSKPSNGEGKTKLSRRSKFISKLSLSPTDGPDFSALPFDMLTKIASPFNFPNLLAASLVCKSWRDALRPLREAMVLLRYGKRFKHGRGGFRRNLEKALDSFLKGAARGSTLAMVDAGLIYWERGQKEEAIALYQKAAALGDPAGQCNLGISYLHAQPQKHKEAIKWLHEASVGGHIRAQYQLALCLHQGLVVDRNLQEAARWYLKAAEGGYVRAMYNTSLCYTFGEGLSHSRRQARKWMKRAADRGHSKAQFEHGLALFSEGEMMKAVVYLELATRSGETAATHVKNVILQQLSATSRDRAMLLADNWHALPSSR